MSAENQHSGIKRWAKWLAWFLVAIILLLLIVRLSLKTSFVQSRVKDFVVSTANAQLNAELTIDGLSGDLWNEITISGLKLVAEDTVARIDSIYISYNILSFLGEQFEVSEVEIYRPIVHLRQQNEQWNVQKLVVESPDTAADTTGTFAFRIDNFALNEGTVTVRSEDLPVESDFTVDELDINSSFSMSEDAFSFNLQNLSFQIEQTQLNAPLKIQTAARADSNSITLEKLVLSTGSSMIRSSAFASQKDSTVRLDLSASPIAWRDIAEYAARFPVNENLQIDLGVSGILPQFTVTLQLQADGLQSFETMARLHWQQDLSLQELEMEMEGFNPAVLLSDTSLPKIQHLKARFAGEVDFSNFENSYGDATLSVTQISLSPYRLDELSASVELKDQSALVNIETHHNEQRVSSRIAVQELWADLPAVDITIEGSNINPAYWMQDTTYMGDLAFRSELNGRGFYPDSALWNYSLTVDGQLMNQPISEFVIDGKVSSRMATLEGHLRIRESVVNMMAEVQNLEEEPVYEYSLESRNVNLGRLMGMENFSTALNAEVTGQGQGFEPASMRLQTFITIDSSLVNGEFVKNLSADIFIRDTVAVIDSLRLRSTIAEGSLTAQMNLLRLYDLENELLLELHLKDINALSPLADVERLQAQGIISGKLSPVDDEKLKFTGSVDFSEVFYDDVFMAAGASGSVEALMDEDLQYMVDLELKEPIFSDVQLQNLSFESQGLSTDSKTTGSFDLQFSSPNEGRIEHGGTFSYSADSIRVHTAKLNIISDQRTLSLQQPFNLLVMGDTLRMDTMRVASDDGAFLQAAAPLITPDEQHLSLRAESLNTTVIQNAVLNEPYFTGKLSARLQVNRVDTVLKARGQLLFSDLMYREVTLDSLFIQTQIRNERLEGAISALYEGSQLIEGEVNLPFKLGDPEKLPPAFFDQSVKGEIRINDISLKRFQNLVEEAGLTNTTGIFSFEGTLDGTAGHPDFSAAATLYDATLSGVPVDSLIAEIDYGHSQSRLDVNASIMMMQQKAAEVEARIPLFVNMQTFDVNFPQDGDSISVHIRTNKFNLAAMNDFLDEQTVREVEGTLDGVVYIMGPLGDLKTDGQLTIQEGAFRFEPAEIRVDNIQTEIVFDPNQVRIDEFLAMSGNGSLEAQGTIELEKLVPGEVDIKVTADNFTAANTPDYSAIIDLESRVQGSFTKPEVSGSLDFVSGYIQLDNFGEEAVEDVELEPEESDSNVSLYDSLSLNMNITFDRRFFVRNERYLELEIELAGEVDLVKNPTEDMQMFGTINAVSGYALPLGKRFELQEGVLTFVGDPTNPRLTIRTQYTPPQTEEEIVIWYIIQGTVEDPVFLYESEPPMELENILSYTLFGKPFYALNPWKQVVAGSGGGGTSATDVALGILLDRVEALATQKLGIDVVKIDNVSVGGENGTAITTGWYISPKVFFAIQNVITGSTPDTSFRLEYLLRENLELIIRQGNGIRQGVDIRWEYDY
ncbi:MAG TPA: translocation/assembly module TamB domain-containing protein [Balneolaceae bacterium]